MIFEFDKELFDNKSSPFVEDLWFSNELDDYFGEASGISGAILNVLFSSKYEIINKHSNVLFSSKYEINNKHSNVLYFAFYKIGLNLDTPPKRIIIKGFDDS